MKKFIQDISPILAGLANLAIILGVIFAMFTFWNEKVKIKADRAQRSADLILRLDDKLEKYLDITDELVTDDGKFSESNIEGLIGVYDLIGELVKQDLLLCSMVGNEFSYEIDKTCKNEEITNYIAEIRKGDSSLYVNFAELCSKFSKGGKGCKDH